MLSHIALIMDGNRRWARKNALSLFLGHSEGVKKVEPLVEYAAKQGIKYLTFWAFSTENWKREKEEVSTLMDVFRAAMKDPMIERLKENGVRVQVLGDLEAFPQDIKEGVQRITEESAHNKTITVNFALNYGGRREIIAGINQLLMAGKSSVTEEEFSSYLYTKDMPDPDLIIRTGGEQRTSGFMPYQSVYSELYFTETLWPAFGVQDFKEAIDWYETRQRRFGK